VCFHPLLAKFQRLQKNAENISLLSSYIEKNADDFNKLSYAVDLLNEVIEQINSDAETKEE
jgi:hypothetical protein